jgi:flagellin
MAQVINTNLASLAVQRNLNANSGAAQTAMERLSTGLRINSARDDAAGLSISSRMTSQINGLNVAARNAADGISLTQTAEGGLGEVASNLQRMRDLAVQSSNATNTQADRDALQLEFTALRSEINRISETANFNGDNLLDGSFTSGVFQVGANAGQTVTIASIANVASGTLGTASTATVSSAATSGITGFNAAVAAGTITVNTVDIGALDAAGSINERVGDLVTAINAVSGQTNVSATHDTANGQITLTGTAAIVLAGTTATNSGFTAATTALSTTTGLDNTNVSGFAASQTAITLIDDALATVNGARSSMGAVQSRFESVVSNLQQASENVEASRSRILDADFAAETAAMTKAQILQQAGISVLSQANAAPQNVLALLQ